MSAAVDIINMKRKLELDMTDTVSLLKNTIMTKNSAMAAQSIVMDMRRKLELDMTDTSTLLNALKYGKRS